MSGQVGIQVPCLGRPFNLGMLYNRRTEEVIPGVTLWNAEKLKSAVLTTDLPASKSETTTEDTIQSKLSSLNMEADMKVSVMSGMVDVKGAAKYLHDRKSSERQCRVTLQFTSTTHFEQLTMDHLGDIQFPHILDDQEATHVVTGLTYGADAFLVFDRSVSEGEAVDKISSSMEAKVKKIPSFVGSASGSSSLQGSNTDKTETDKFQCKFHGDFIPKSNPTTFDEALKFCKDLPELLKEGTKPKLAHLMPLSKFLGSNQQMIHPIPHTLVSQVEDVMEHFHHTEVRASDLRGHDLCNKFVEIKNQLSMFIKLLVRFKEDFLEKLSKILPKIRTEGAGAEGLKLAELISSIYKSPYSPSETETYLKGKDGEIKQLAQLLKNMEKYSNIQHDFADTQCDLKTLANDDEFDHVVCFAFNVTSETCGYLENLKSYIEGSETELADTEEWFDKSDVVKKLNSEVETFKKLSSTTKDKAIAFVATSSTKDANKFDPSILVYTLDFPMPFDQPGPPQASKVTIDSITVTWAPLKRAKVQSYKVLYRSTKETEFITIASQGFVTTRYIKDLSHGVEYEFKIQATTTAGFKVESESTCIKTTEYYDIVLIGKTGQGKSTLGNKLLDLESTAESEICLFHPRSKEEANKKRFIQADDQEVVEAGEQMLSVTGRCKLMSNEDTKIRVLDVPGFSDSGTLNRALGKNISVYNGNLQIIRWVVREQIQSQLMVRRIVYFLPVRGPLEKADGTMQEELKVLYHYFGKDVFNCMVVVATSHPREKYQELKFDNDDYKVTTKVFHCALKTAIDDEDIACPPVIHIGLRESTDEILCKIRSALVLRESVLPLRFTDGVCALCSFGIRYSDDERICVVDAHGNSTPYTESKCHPLFVPKYSGAQKFFGGVGHIATLGIGLIVERIANVNTWPGFTNSDEMCVSCSNSPGSEGCATVGQKITFERNEKKETIKVDHSNKL